MIINGTECSREEVFAALWLDFAQECHEDATTFGDNPHDTGHAVWACEGDSYYHATTPEQEDVVHRLLGLSLALDGGLKYG